jgi:hypothetical protein
MISVKECLLFIYKKYMAFCCGYVYMTQKLETVLWEKNKKIISAPQRDSNPKSKQLSGLRTTP